MKLYPDIFREFASSSGRLRTQASHDSFQSIIRQLQQAHPRQTVGQFTSTQLTDFCLEAHLAPNSRRHRKAVLMSVFAWAEWKGYIKANPASVLKYSVVPGKHEVRPGHWLEEPEIATMLRSCDDSPRGRRDRLILLFGFMMGLRRFEIEALRWSMFSHDLRQLNMVGKGNKIATLGVPAQLAAELAAWRTEAPAGTDIVLPYYRITNIPHRAITIDWSQGLKRSGIANVMKAAAQRCGMKVAPHDMRRSFAGLLEAKGKPVTDIQRAMRHENVGTTSTYLDKNPRKTVAVTEGLTIDY